MNARDSKASGMDDVLSLIGNMQRPQAAEPQAPAAVQPSGPAYEAPAKVEPAPAAPTQGTSRSRRDRRDQEKADEPRGIDAENEADPIEPEVPASGDTQTTGASLEDPTPPTGDVDPEESKGAPARRKKRTGERADQVDKGKRVARSVYIPADVTKLLGIGRVALRRSYTDITLDAVNRHYKNAATLPDRAGGAGQMTGGLFPREIAPKKSKKGLESIYLSDAETKVLDKVAADAGVSRSDLVSRCMRAYLSRMVFTTMETVLELQDSGRPEASLREKVERLLNEESVARPMPEDLEEWIVAPNWMLGMSKILDEAQRELDLGSWSEVVWAAMEPVGVR
jgi:hypothetical protein